MSQANWDERYGATDRVWSGAPNPWLVEVAESLVPGSALDVGCGEGADAIWLAGHGWATTAVDFSPVALSRARSAAGDVSVRWEQRDLATWVPDRRFDLVSVQFFHAEPAVREAVHRAAWQVTAGVLLVVGHDLAHPGPPPEEVRYGVSDIVAALPGAEIVRAETRERPRDAAPPAVDAVVVARRRG